VVVVVFQSKDPLLLHPTKKLNFNFPVLFLPPEFHISFLSKGNLKLLGILSLYFHKNVEKQEGLELERQNQNHLTKGDRRHRVGSQAFN